MLIGMDISAATITATTVPWVVLGIVLLALAALVAVRMLRRTGDRQEVPPSPESARLSASGYREDDLAGFLDSPPGFGGEPAAPPRGWPALSSPPVLLPATATSADASRSRTGTAGVLTAMAVAALLLVGSAAVVAGSARSPGSSRDPAPPTTPRDDDTASAPPRPGDRAARLTFGGVVLERRAVGVTVTYPGIRFSSNGGRALAHVELPTFNCLSDEAPDDPIGAGCTRSVTEYADLAAPDLVVRSDGDRLRLSGRFPTYLRPNGSPPVRTDRSYELVITVAPEDAGSTDAVRRAEGVLELGSDRARTTVDGPNELRHRN
jgi:hypothetical protein